MIRHTPLGRGHPYQSDPDQRAPVRPVAGDWLELRAVCDVETEVRVELANRSVIAAVDRGPAHPDEEPEYGRTADSAGTGHLTDVTDVAPEFAGLHTWSTVVLAPPAGEELRYRFVAGGDATDWFTVASCAWRRDAAALAVEAPPAVRDRLSDGSIEVLTDGRCAYRLRFTMRLNPDERVVGFGERFDSLDQRGRYVDTAVYDQYKSQGARSYLPMPYAVVAGGGFGFHVDTARRCFFDVGATRSDRIAVEVDLEPGVETPDLKLVLLEGEPADVVRAFVERTAASAEPPPSWVYRLWLSGNEWNSQKRILDEVRRAEREEIPVGAVVVEAWSDETTFVAFNDAEYEPHPDGSPHRLADFRFPADGRWPDPKGLVDELHRRDVKVLLWQIPLVQSDEGQAGFDRRVMIERGYAIRSADRLPYRNRSGWFRHALMLDFTNAEGVEWWTEKRRYLVEDVGVDGFKTDGGEHAWGADLVYADGSRGGESNNLNPVRYAAAYHDLLRSCGRPPVTFSRAGFTGAGAVPCHWAGDADSSWEAFRASITAGLTAAVSGVFFWGWDIGGFSGPLPTAELFLRATAMGALCPVMQLHSEFNFHRTPSRDRTPWNLYEQTGDDRVLPMFRRFAHLRERLVPYLARSGVEAVAEGRPLMRPLFLDHPRDEAVWGFPYEYLLGDALLVAPVCAEGATEWVVYLPDGEWVDVWTEDEAEGGQVVTVPAPLDRIPVFCRADETAELLPAFAAAGDARVKPELQEVQ